MGVGGFLRFDNLSKRPFHADEATGARITASRMESGDYHFDPLHYHGPLLSSLAMPISKMRGESTWQEMTKATPRTLTAIAGTLLLLVPLLWRRRFGDAPILLAASLLATSPLLVYYSRMFIHESLIVLFGMMALALITRSPKWILAGICVGSMFATKESFAISMVAWCGAAVMVAWENRQEILRRPWLEHYKNHRKSIGMFLALAAITSLYFYTDGFRKPEGALDSVRTFFVYKTVDGHDKPFDYYLHLLALPMKSGGMWWFGTPLVLLALIAFASTFRRHPDAARGRTTIRFIAYAAVGHFLIYSIIRYKTPWLACLPWAHVCVLAGTGIVGFSSRSRWMKYFLVLLVGCCLVTQLTQARRATGRFASDGRNPFAYVPTRGDLETLGPWLLQLAKIAPGQTLEPIGIIGTDYWPLPWYLRDFKKIGYWKTPSDDLESLPIILVMPDMENVVAERLAKSHTALPRGLRAGVPMTLLVRNDIWKRWMESDL